MINALGSLGSLRWIHREVSILQWWIHLEVWLRCDEYTGESTSWCIYNQHQNRFTKNFLVTNRPGSKDSPCINNRGVLTSSVFCTSRFFVNLFRLTPWCIHHQGVSTPWWWILRGFTISQWWIHQRVSTPVPSCEYTGESISRILKKNWNPF